MQTIEYMNMVFVLSGGNVGVVALLTHFLNLMDKNKNAKFVFDSLNRHAINGDVLYALYKFSCLGSVEKFVIFLQALDNGLIYQNDLVAIKSRQVVSFDWDGLKTSLKDKCVDPWFTTEQAKNPKFRKSPYH